MNAGVRLHAVGPRGDRFVPRDREQAGIQLKNAVERPMRLV